MKHSLSKCTPYGLCRSVIFPKRKVSERSIFSPHDRGLFVLPQSGYLLTANIVHFFPLAVSETG
jgi:hypothetical protein